MSRAAPPTGLSSAAAALLCAWTLLAAGAVLTPVTGAPLATAIAFSAAAALVCVVAGCQRPEQGLLSVACAAASGFASFPAWVASIAAVGLTAGLAPRTSIASSGTAPLTWLSLVLLAPLFEELLYRRLLLPPLRERFGALPAIVVTSALFALPHLEPWQVLGTFLVGLALGTVFVVTGEVWLCIALHTGLNAAALACGSPPLRWALDPGSAALAGLALLGLALVAPRARRIGSPHRRRALVRNAG